MFDIQLDQTRAEEVTHNDYSLDSLLSEPFSRKINWHTLKANGQVQEHRVS